MLFTAISQLQRVCAAWEPLSPHRPTSPAETRVIRGWRLGHLLKIFREKFAGECKASNHIFQDICGCSLVDCQAGGINSHSRLILQSIIQAADVRIQNYALQWWPYCHICCSSLALLPPHCEQEKKRFSFTGTVSSCMNRLKLRLFCQWHQMWMLKTSIEINQCNVEGATDSPALLLNTHTQRQALKGWWVRGLLCLRQTTAEEHQSIFVLPSLKSLRRRCDPYGVPENLRSHVRTIPYLVVLTHISGELSHIGWI